MTDYRQDRSDTFKKPLVERGNPHGGHGRRAQSKLAEQFETQTGRPLGGAPDTSGERTPVDTKRHRMRRAVNTLARVRRRVRASER